MGKIRFRKYLAYVGALGMFTVLIGVGQVFAITPLPLPDPIPGSYGLEATKLVDPPKVGATISTPGNGSSFSDSPITVTGICPTNLLVEIYNNEVMVGAVMCNNGSFSLRVSLFAGVNELKARVYDGLDQVGPESAITKVNYNNARLTAFGELVTLTSSYGRRATPFGSILTWPLQLSGGQGPYAFSIDWGDGSQPELKSQSLAGTIDINHSYKKAGIYYVNVMVTDVNGVSAFIQLVAVASGEATTGGGSTDNTTETGTIVQILWWPMVVLLILLLPTYWLGRRSQLISIRNKMVKERDQYAEQEKEDNDKAEQKNIAQNA